ncbi:class I SAM-dependent methyltransferase [Microbulbifer sp. DLAB2-AF]|uniref:class I SAM-dependent methyltransferase n=1 Tax=Microbulbifer sp. DLAB2-AF TaxID=3243395 RepID=UPI0040397C4F
MENLEQWSRFWQQGYPTSFSQELPDSYCGAIGLYWRSLASKLETQAHILDIASGNGAIAILIAQEALENKRHIIVHAADAAMINPQETNKNPRHKDILETIKFHPEMPIEKIHLLNEQFDLITSQYGLEYSNIEKSAPSIAHCLKVGGTLKAICHSKDSELSKSSEEELSAYYESKEKLKILDQTKLFLEHIGTIHSIQQLERKIVSTSTKLESLVNCIEELIKRHPKAAITSFLRNSINNFFSTRLISDSTTKEKFISFLESELDASAARSKDQQKAALTAGEMNDVLGIFSKNRFKTLKFQSFNDDHNKNIGWLIELERL